ncbi:phospholipase A1-II 1-like [Malania oleifera]|uniref:phospholipase A1-II 1-like n=1 Tax=Malania oleifera TaxID=397392 RepID=UPI0025ADF603|nr:phospholipase A1-II 1-like [Malania oleifera]
MSSIAENWELLSGEKNWEGLLDPLDLNLGRYLIHYGERAGAAGDAFIAEEKSKNCGLPRHAKKHFFSEVGLEYGNPFRYEVKTYFYATTNIKGGSGVYTVKSISREGAAGNSNFVGYVAVSTEEGSRAMGRRDILIAWRGTKRNVEAQVDGVAVLFPASEILGRKNNPMVHGGWYSLYTTAENGSKYNSTSCRDQVLAQVRKLVDTYKEEEISITVAGYSMGAALATLSAADITVNGYNKPTNGTSSCPVTVFAFASPRVGDGGFRQVVADHGSDLHVLRIRNVKDPVPDTPYFGYADVGKELVVDACRSPYYKQSSNQYHDLEVYLHGVAGSHGGRGQGAFKLEVKRDIALMNKWADAVRDEYEVVTHWWVAKNNSMVQVEDGSWVLKDCEPDDDDDDHI